MKKIKKVLPLVFFFGIVVLAGCKKNKLGTTQTNFEVGSVYKADSDGLLTVHYKTNGFGADTWVKIYIDQNSNPTTLNSEMSTTSSSTLAVHKKDYWKIEQKGDGSVKIEFTPFE